MQPSGFLQFKHLKYLILMLKSWENAVNLHSNFSPKAISSLRSYRLGAVLPCSKLIFQISDVSLPSRINS